MAVEWDISPEEALVKIREEKPHVKRQRQLQEAFHEADARIAEDVPCMSKGQRQRLAAEMMRGVLSPLTKFVQLKTKMLRARVHLLGRHAELICRMRQCKSCLTST